MLVYWIFLFCFRNTIKLSPHTRTREVALAHRCRCVLGPTWATGWRLHNLCVTDFVEHIFSSIFLDKVLYDVSYSWKWQYSSKIKQAYKQTTMESSGGIVLTISVLEDEVESDCEKRNYFEYDDKIFFFFFVACC